jgi:hypothetical protein
MTSASTHTFDDLMNAAEAGVDRGCRYLLDRIDPSGSPGARHCHYYRVPWALALSGHRRHAAAVLSWVERNALERNGDLRPEARIGFETHWSSYPLANLATGAWHLERYDTANLLAGRLAEFQHPEVGGAYAAHPDHRSDQRQDLFPTAQLGMTGLTTGHLDLAHGAFRWMRLLYDSQPELPDRLYSATNGDQLITDIADDTMAWQVVTDFTKPRQAFYNPGIAAAFLGRYHLATGSADALELATKYLALTVSGTKAQFDHTDSVQVCKFAWGASVLYEATGETAYLDHILTMAQWFLDAQNDDGSWDNSPFLMARAAHPPSVRIEVTAEFVQHLNTILNAASSHPRPTKGETR